MFDVSAGWLKYHPTSKYRLPTHYYAETPRDETRDRAEFVDKRSGTVVRTSALWYLHWPGQTSPEKARDALVPMSIIRRWPTFKPVEGQDQSHLSVGEILEQGIMPPEPPETLAYHIAVNYQGLGFDSVPFPVCGLPAARVQQVIDARFAMDKDASAAATYLKWVAEGHRTHPLLQGFDTNIREELMGLNHEAVRLYFYLVSDYLYDAESKWWAHDTKRLWLPMAIYLHWVGRTGMGLYSSFAGFRGGPWHVKRAQEEVEKAEDLKSRLVEWDMWTMRNHMRDEDEPEGGIGPALD